MKLKKLKMPAKAEISTAELDMEEMPEGPKMAGEMEGEGEGEMGESPEAAPGSDMLADFSDDELMAEIKKRGLMGKMGEEEGEEMESEEEEYMS